MHTACAYYDGMTVRLILVNGTLLWWRILRQFGKQSHLIYIS